MAQSSQNGTSSPGSWRQARLGDLLVPVDQDWAEPREPRFDDVEFEPELVELAPFERVEVPEAIEHAASVEPEAVEDEELVEPEAVEVAEAQDEEFVESKAIEVEEAVEPDEVEVGEVAADGPLIDISGFDDLASQLATLRQRLEALPESEEDAPVDEMVSADHVAPADEVVSAPEVAPADEVHSVDETAPLDNASAVDETALLEELVPVDETALLDELVPVDETAPIDEVLGVDEAAPVDTSSPSTDVSGDDRAPAHTEAELDAAAAAFVERLAQRRLDTAANSLSLTSRPRNNRPLIDWDAIDDRADSVEAALPAPPSPADPETPGEVDTASVDPVAELQGDLEQLDAHVDHGDAGPHNDGLGGEADLDDGVAARADLDDGVAVRADIDDDDVVIDLRTARPPAVADRPSHPPRLQAPEPNSGPAARPISSIASSVAPTDRSAAARTTIITSLIAGGLRAEDLLVVDRVAAASATTISPRLDPVVADELDSRLVPTTVAGEPIPLALGLAWLPSARRVARRIVAVVHHSELLTGTTWAALDAVGHAPDAPVTVVVTVDPSDLPRTERPDRLVQRWARRFLDLGWRAVDLRYGRDQRLAEEDGSALETSELDAAALDEAIAEGEVSVGGNDLSDLEWVWDTVHRSSRATVVFTYVRPPEAGEPVLPETIAALGTQLLGGEPIDPPATFGLVRFDATDTTAESTEMAAIEAIECLLVESDELARRVALISLGRRPVSAPSGVSTIEIGDAVSAAILARATHTLGHIPILIGREHDLAPALLSLTAGADRDARVVVIALSDADRGGARAPAVPAIVESSPGIELVEPFSPAWVEAELRDALHRAEAGAGSTYLRVSEVAVSPVEVDDAQLASGLRRGGLLLHQTAATPEVMIVAAGHLVPAALDAARVLDAGGIGCDVAAITAPERLRFDAGSLDARPGMGGVDRMMVPGRDHHLVIALHGGADLEWIGGAAGIKTVRLDRAAEVDDIVASAQVYLGDHV